MQVLTMKSTNTANGNAEVNIEHLGDRLLITAELTEGNGATVTVKLIGPAVGQKTVELSKKKPKGGLFIKLPRGTYTLEIDLNGTQVYSETFTASPVGPGSPLIPAVILAVLGIWGW